MRRFIVELGWGCDLHGGDVTKACRRAVRDAVGCSCLCGLLELCGVRDLSRDVVVEVEGACPDPERVMAEEVLAEIPIGRKKLRAKEGGMRTRGLEVPDFGPGGEIVVACAAVTVWVAEEELGGD